jgi:YidC/Oxa1 family membrane protein insertase
MEKRFLLAVLLTGAVVVLTPGLFPRSAPPRSAPPGNPATNVELPSPGTGSVPAPAPTGVAASRPAKEKSDTVPKVAAETVTVHTSTSTYVFSTLGAAPLAIRADSYPALNGQGGPVTLRHGREPLLRFRVVTANDTIALDRMTFSATRSTASDQSELLTFAGARGKTAVSLQYHFANDNYLTAISVSMTDVAPPAFLLVDLPSGFDTQEADSAGDMRLLAYAVKPAARGARGISFASLDSGERKLEPGPLSWVVAKSKYFLVGLLVPTGGTPFAEAHLEGGARTRKVATNGSATVVAGLDNGKASFELYAGPQSWRRLHELGREFETANPYGGWLQPIVQPFSTIVMRVLLWMKKVLRFDYGWVLVIFGVAVRLLMWPLNQSAMRTSLRMQRIQPELMEVQKKYKSDPQKQQQEIMRVYKEHGMSPFSAFSGCLPALIPMPVLMALFFVFQNTIEFRGVPFLWLHDISLHDPYYVLPLVMGASMFVLSWIGMRNMPPNPQSKMISYMLPVMLTVFLLQSAAGLSLYYTVQNIAALPQQWLIANERAKSKRVT